MAEKKKYVVGNPHELPDGMPMISWQEFTWYAGDEFQAPDGLKIQRLIDKRYLVDPSKTVEETKPKAEDESEEDVDG